MEALIYFSIKLIATIYILFKVWVWLFRGAAAKLIWNNLPVQTTMVRPEPTLPRPAVSPVVGTTKSVILEDPGRGTPSLEAGTDLEPTGYIGAEEDLSAEDVESDYLPPESAMPKAEELYDEPDASNYDPELSGGGVTFEQIGEAINALTGTGTLDEAAKSRARNTLIELQDTDILNVITREVCDEVTLDQFLNDGDTTGKAEKLEDIRIKDFDLAKYV